MNDPNVYAGRTEWERGQYHADCGTHAAKAQAFIRVGLLLEYDEDSPAPILMTHSLEGGKVIETMWGCAALPSAGDEAGCGAVRRFAAKHHVTAGWDEDGRYRAVIVLGGGYRYGAFYLPERSLHPAGAGPGAREDADKGAAGTGGGVMATGPEHYREAEAYLSVLDEQRTPEEWEAAIRSGEIGRAIDAAQAHALLSLAAATALGSEGEGRTQPSKDRTAWFEAASECKKAVA